MSMEGSNTTIPSYTILYHPIPWILTFQNGHVSQPPVRKTWIGLAEKEDIVLESSFVDVGTASFSFTCPLNSRHGSFMVEIGRVLRVADGYGPLSLIN